jgi:AcrR family transcriptional regulator
VAARAGVSKALVHYHYHDKDSLLATLVADVGEATLVRARGALRASDASHALDAYWEWVDAELRGGDIGILMALADYDSERVREASRQIAEQRRVATTEHVAEVFSRLGLAPRLPPALIADTVLAFTDGLAAARALTPERDSRPAFDVLWLALLTLAE